MKIKTMELTGEALDWAVSKALQPGYEDWRTTEHVRQGFNPSTKWEHGGPIIERERICVMPADEDLGTYWGAGKRSTKLYTGETHLIAAMRYYVGCNLGDEVDVPDPLAKSEKV
jgi:hypothetical protein